MSRRAPHAREPVLRSWTVQRASSVGIVAGLVTLVAWIAHTAYPETMRFPFLAAAAVTALCGLSILWITAQDMMTHRPRGSRLVPLRSFDVALGLLLALPSLYAVQALLDR